MVEATRISPGAADKLRLLLSDDEWYSLQELREYLGEDPTTHLEQLDNQGRIETTEAQTGDIWVRGKQHHIQLDPTTGYTTIIMAPSRIAAYLMDGAGPRKQRWTRKHPCISPYNYIGYTGPWTRAQPNTPCPHCTGMDLDTGEYCLYCDRWGSDQEGVLELSLKVLEANSRKGYGHPDVTNPKTKENSKILREGMKIGTLTLISREIIATNRKRSEGRWVCECDCGHTETLNHVRIKNKGKCTECSLEREPFTDTQARLIETIFPWFQTRVKYFQARYKNAPPDEVEEHAMWAMVASVLSYDTTKLGRGDTIDDLEKRVFQAIEWEIRFQLIKKRATDTMSEDAWGFVADKTTDQEGYVEQEAASVWLTDLPEDERKLTEMHLKFDLSLQSIAELTGSSRKRVTPVLKGGMDGMRSRYSG